MPLYKLEDGAIVISSKGYGYLPGVYADERAAKYAYRFSPAKLQKLQDSINPDGLITFEMLQELRKEEEMN